MKFKKGEIVEITSTYRKKLALCSLDGERSIRAVDTWNVNVIADEGGKE